MTTHPSADPSSVRRWNERAVISALASGEAQRVAQIATTAGLTSASVRDVLRTLAHKGWVTGQEPVNGGMGRPARTFHLANPSPLVLGLDLGGHAVRAVVADLRGDVRVVGEATLSDPGDLGATRRVIAGVLAEVPLDRIWTTGLSVSGVLDAEGRLVRSIASPHLNGFRPAEVFADSLPGDVLTCHDTKSALWAEHRLGAAHGVRDVLFVNLGRRLSIAMLLDGQLYRGAHGSSGELSLNELLPRGATAVDDWTGSGADSPSGVPAGDPAVHAADRQGEALRAALAGDERAIATAQAFLHRIAAPIAYAVGLIDPELIVIGGALSPVVAPALPTFAEELGTRLEFPPQIALSPLDQYAAAIGACHLARERLYSRLLDAPEAVAPLTRAAFEASC